MTRKAGSTGDGGAFVPASDDGLPRVGGKVVKVWRGDPGACGFCGDALIDYRNFVDGATVIGPWANMCPKCYRRNGVGLGTGRGQQYSRVRLDGGGFAWVKVGG